MITPERINIQQEETSRRRPVSESVLSRVGAGINFVNNRQYDTHAFHLNGLYRKGMTTIGRDGIFPIIFDMEIIAISMFNRVVGTSSNTQFDLRWLSSSGTVVGSIFSTKPRFTTATGNNAYMIRNFLTSTTSAIPSSGATVPVLSKSEFDAGDALLLRIDSAMVGAEDASLLIHFRPR